MRYSLSTVMCIQALNAKSLKEDDLQFRTESIYVFFLALWLLRPLDLMHLTVLKWN